MLFPLKGGLDIPRFGKLHTDVCERLLSLCEGRGAKKTLLENSGSDIKKRFVDLVLNVIFVNVFNLKYISWKSYPRIAFKSDTTCHHLKVMTLQFF